MTAVIATQSSVGVHNSKLIYKHFLFGELHDIDRCFFLMFVEKKEIVNGFCFAL